MPQIDRTLAMYGLVFGIGGSMAVLLFWVIAALNVQRGYGLVHQLELSGMWSTAFYAYPFLLAAAAAGALIAFFANREPVAVGVGGLPVVAAIAFYFALLFRG